MPLDHYVSQVHLKKFYSPTLDDQMYAIRKSDLFTYIARSQDVCRTREGSTNTYLREQRRIEDFLETVEPNYNTALINLTTGNVDRECIQTFAGFMTYVLCCSPAAMRIQSEPLRKVVETTATLMEKRGLLPPIPAELGSTNIGQLLRDEVIDIKIDPKYPQALGIDNIVQLANMFGNFSWDVLINEYQDNPFFTSDFPVAIEETNDPRILNRIVPLAPNVAIRIRPDLRQGDGRFDPNFSRFRCRSRKIGREEIIRLNRIIVRCAEDNIFYRDNHEWIPAFVEKNRSYRIEPYSRTIRVGSGELIIFTQRLSCTGASKGA